jgi:hypothetical protein
MSMRHDASEFRGYICSGGIDKSVIVLPQFGFNSEKEELNPWWRAGDPPTGHIGLGLVWEQGDECRPHGEDRPPRARDRADKAEEITNQFIIN